MIDRHIAAELTDGELHWISSGRGQTEDELQMKIIPPMLRKDYWSLGGR
jgi:hypothetical protein